MCPDFIQGACTESPDGQVQGATTTTTTNNNNNNDLYFLR